MPRHVGLAVPHPVTKVTSPSDQSGLSKLWVEFCLLSA